VETSIESSATFAGRTRATGVGHQTGDDQRLGEARSARPRTREEADQAGYQGAHPAIEQTRLPHSGTVAVSFIIRIQEFVTAGAVVQEDLSDAQLIISVKAVPIDQLIPEKTYAFFSHTIKAQPDNMPLLDTVLQRVCRYGRRTIGCRRSD
jgi:hypothetical protein